MTALLKPRSFKLNAACINQLETIAHARNNTLSGTVRQLIQHAYDHQILGLPRCASGNPCLVPATWEQHIALRTLAEARHAANETAQAQPDTDPDGIPYPQTVAFPANY